MKSIKIVKLRSMRLIVDKIGDIVIIVKVLW